MPTYVYKFVATNETIEVEQAFTDDTLTKIKHPESGRKMAVKKVFQPVGVTFRGSGFFKNDNRGSETKKSESSSDTSGGSGSEASSSSESSSSTDSAKSESKAPESKKSDKKTAAKKPDAKKSSTNSSS
jgi:predicted nucleic acid-binding Zn ribbon protein